jgi:hypothetical protein
MFETIEVDSPNYSDITILAGEGTVALKGFILPLFFLFDSYEPGYTCGTPANTS